MDTVKYYRATSREKENILNKIKAYVSCKEEILIAIVYGSFIRRDFFRDIDLAVYTGGLISDPLRFESMLCLELSKIVKVPVDAKVIDDAPVWFKLKILSEGIVIYEKRAGIYALYLKEVIGDHQDIEIKYKSYCKGNGQN